MKKSQCYIGTPNGIVLCIDSFYGRQMRGRFYHRYKKGATVFANTEQMLFKFEKFFDDVNFPHPATTERMFRRTGSDKLAGAYHMDREEPDALLPFHMGDD